MLMSFWASGLADYAYGIAQGSPSLCLVSLMLQAGAFRSTLPVLGEQGCELRARCIRASRLRLWDDEPAVVFGQPVRLHLTGNGANANNPYLCVRPRS
jgi:hypothetical protein